MTVIELIDLLEDLPGDLEVVYQGDEGDWWSVKQVSEEANVVLIS